MAQSLERLLVRRDFLAAAKGASKATKGLVLQLRARDDERAEIRFGLTATKKIGPAVTRNRAKRRLRALAREILPKEGRSGMDYVLIGRLETGRRNFNDLRNDLLYALRKLHREIDQNEQNPSKAKNWAQG